MSLKSVGKITAKLVIGSTLTDIAKKTLEGKSSNKPYSFDRFEAMRIQGRVDKVTVKPSALNPENADVKLTGEFIATNIQDGEQFHSGSLYPMGSGMTELMSTAKPGSMFAIRVFVAPSTKSLQGYAFDFETAMEIKPDEAVQRLSDAFLSLPAPPAKKPEQKETKKGK